MKTRSSSSIPSGFNYKPKSCKFYIDNFFQQHRDNLSLHVTRQQRLWSNDYESRNYEYSLEDLLQCERKNLAIDTNQLHYQVNSSHSHLKRLISGHNGFWSLVVYRDCHYRRYEFTISVFSGDMYKFHPATIRNDICRKYGDQVYNAWRSMILDDIRSLRLLVDSIRSEIYFAATSITCSPSSARLCRRVGIPVRNDIAFLFPSDYC